MQVNTALTEPSELAIGNRRKFSDKAYLEFCETNPDLRVERTADGEIVMVPPAGGESSFRSLGAAMQLGVWAQKNGRGKAFDSSAQFMLPDGSSLSPDTAWVSIESLNRLSKDDRKVFLRLCPEFVIEVLSPSDRLQKAKAKMEQWIANGAQLGWLIDGDRQTVHIYQPNQPVETRKGILKLAGKGPVKGFVLQLRTIWDGLK
jgi:Uma2 family endonuclease